MTTLDVHETSTPLEPVGESSAGRRAWTAWVLVAVILVGAGFGARYILQARQQAARSVFLNSVVLEAQQLPVGPADAATVAAVQVAAGDVVQTGQTLAQLTLPSSATVATDSGGNSSVLLAPTDGVIVSVSHPAGSVVKAGEAVVTEYASSSLSFLATVAVRHAQKLRIGMGASVDGPGLSEPIEATVGAAQPNLAGSTPDVIEVTLIPRQLSDVEKLIPGLGFRATVALTSAPKDAAPVLGVGP